ncbi:MAG: restriction endonuclease [Trueperaceae bacterium]|nr:restriction endonuclease [Trueperaceae bacterium]
MNESVTLWGIHAGRGSEADALFKKQCVVALGWAATPDLSSLPGDRQAFKDAYRAAYPEQGDGNVVTSASQLFRFVHEMRVGDLVAFPSKVDRRVYLGRVEGSYRFVGDASHTFKHQRSVKWLRDVARTQYSQGALHELGSALSLFQVKNYADEHLALLEGQVVAPEPGRDETVGPVAEEIEETTRDFVLKALARELKGHPFAGFVGHLLEVMGYRTRVARPGPDGGIDIVAHKDELGFEPPIIKVQVKANEGSVGAPIVQALYGNVEASEFGLLVTLGEFTSAARSFAHAKANLRLVDGGDLVALVLEHYERLDSRYKGLLPLKRVYVPEAVEAE